MVKASLRVPFVSHREWRAMEGCSRLRLRMPTQKTHNKKHLQNQRQTVQRSLIPGKPRNSYCSRPHSCECRQAHPPFRHRQRQRGKAGDKHQLVSRLGLKFVDWERRGLNTSNTHAFLFILRRGGQTSAIMGQSIRPIVAPKTCQRLLLRAA